MNFIRNLNCFSDHNLINFDQNLSFTKDLPLNVSLTLRPLPHITCLLALALTKLD